MIFSLLPYLFSQTAVGGQAVIEGVMMRNGEKIACVVRKKDGTLVRHEETVTPWGAEYGVQKIPLLRGVVALFQMMFIGVRLLLWSAEEAGEDEGFEKLTLWKNALLVAISLGMSIFLFILVPLGISYLMKEILPETFSQSIFFNGLYGMMKVCMFLGYVTLVSYMPDVYRVFQYHGAEHKAIHTYEHGKDLTVENALPFTRLHPRCGTSFLVFALGISIVVYSFIPPSLEWYVSFLVRVSILPFIAGIGFEILKYSARHENHPLMKALIWPGLQVQKITTKEPDAKQMEVGLESLKMVV